MNTTRRTIRIEAELWNAAKAKANKEGTDVTAIIRKLLRSYVRSGAVVLAATAAVFLLGACGTETPASSPVAERTAAVGTPVAETPGEAVSEAPDVRPTVKPLGERFAVGHVGTIKISQTEPRTYAVEVYTGELVEFAGEYVGTDGAGIEYVGTPLVPVLRAHGVGGQLVTFDADVVSITYTDAILDVSFTWTVA